MVSRSSHSHARMQTPQPTQPSLNTTGRMLVLVAAFLGWGFAGVHMSITSQSMRPAAMDLLANVGELDLARYAELKSAGAEANDIAVLEAWDEAIAGWFAYYVCAFLFGAAAGGLLFGWLGDRVGRSKGMAASILCYSIGSACAYFVESPSQLVIVRFATCLGVGGMWPNGVALVSEAWSKLSRPMVAGLIGTAANVGIFCMATLASKVEVTPQDWRWTMLVGAAPVALAVFTILFVPESPSWRATREDQGDASPSSPAATPVGVVFRPPYLGVTLVGIVLATVPLIGGWGSANWMVPWADEVGMALDNPDPFLKAQVGQARALTGMLGSLLGGWIASLVGRRRSYFLVSLGALASAQYAFWFLTPTDASFLWLVSILGFFSGVYFGWLPLFLPELFPTRARSTGAGVSFNFGRILTAITVFATGALKQLFDGDYAQIGRTTSLVYLAGMVIILFAPDTQSRQPDSDESTP